MEESIAGMRGRTESVADCTRLRDNTCMAPGRGGGGGGLRDSTCMAPGRGGGGE